MTHKEIKERKQQAKLVGAEHQRAFLSGKLYAGYKMMGAVNRYIIINKDGTSMFELKNPERGGTAKAMYPQPRAYGYTVTSIKGFNLYIHRLVGEAFNGPIAKGLTIDHIDGDHHNNDLSNLQLMTQAENSRKGIEDTMKKYGTRQLAKGVK